MVPDRTLDGSGLARDVLAQMLGKSPLLREIPQAALIALEREFKVRSFAAREVVFFEDQRQDAVLVMLRGVATLTYLDARHRRVLFAVVGPGEVCVHTDALPEPLRGRLRCDAVRDCVIASLDAKRLIELLFGVPFGRFAAGMQFVFGCRDERLARVMRARGKTLRERLLEVIEDLCARFGSFEHDVVVLDLPLTHEDLADLVGASRPKVTREVRLLEKAGTVTRQGRLFRVKRDHKL